MSHAGTEQGFIIKSIYFVYYSLFASVIQILVFYIYGQGFFTTYIVTGILSLLLSFSLTTNNKFPIFKIIIFFLLLYTVNSQLSSYVVEWAERFYSPTALWAILMTVSIPIGIISSIGRYGNGRLKSQLENYSNFALFIILVLSFVFFWWEGGIAYLVIRLPLMAFELTIANNITSSNKNNQDHPVLDQNNP